MASIDPAWMNELKDMFKEEGIEHIKNISNGLTTLEHSTTVEAGEIIETIFREAHSLKGAARSIGLTDIERICQPIEDVLAECKQGNLKLKNKHFDVIHECLHALEVCLKTDNCIDPDSWEQSIKSLLPGSITLDEQCSPSISQLKTRKVTRDTLHKLRMDTLRISADRVEKLMLCAEEFIAPKLAVDNLATDIRSLLQNIVQWRSDLELKRRVTNNSSKTIRNEGHHTTQSTDYQLIENLNQRMLGIESELEHISQNADMESRKLNSMVDRIIDEMKCVLMLPFENLLKIMPHTVKEIARTLGKRVKLTQDGGQIEVDRRILDGIKDPLIHLLRNAVDHGIETAEERLAAGKDESGQIGLSITPLDEGQVEIRLWDDGKGIDLQSVRNAAVKRGLLDEEAAKALSTQEVMELIFLSDMSTRTSVNELSGRGLGLAIVRDKVEELGGRLILESQPGEGSVFRMILPIKLTNFRGIVVESAGRFLVIPTHSVQRTGRILSSSITDIDGQLVILDGDRYISYYDMDELLNLSFAENSIPEKKYQQIVIISSQYLRIAIGIDEVHREQEVLIKNLGKQLVRVKNVTGATVLGNGRIVPVLNATDLVATANLFQKDRVRNSDGIGHITKKSILVAEDSVTTRSVIEKILNAAGYNVYTAEDGIDAINNLNKHDVDLVVSDVEMPGMNGFDLVKRIRCHPDLNNMPVILMTGLDGREFKERGLEVGANAYLTKKSFDQAQLLTIVRQLI
ncbi:response regulator [bacterium]|nr:response regulator [bacterium]